MRQNIEVYIERLVLYGFDHVNRYRVGEVLRCKLAHLFSEQGAPPKLSQGGEFPHLDGGTFNVAPNSKVQEIGGQVAQSVYSGFIK